MEKIINIKHLISRIRYDRILILVLIILNVCTYIGWISKHFTKTNYTIEANNQANYNILPTKTKFNFTEPTDTVTENSDYADSVIPEEYMIENFDAILQLPELPTGCEVTALTMMLNFYDCNITKIEMAEQYLPTADYDYYYNDDDIMIGPDIDCMFIGDPESESGLICGSQAIQIAANNYFDDTDKSYQASYLIGLSPEELYELVSKDTPVFVLVTIEMKDRFEAEGWYTEDGKYVDWSTNDHGAVLIGYSNDTVTIADPLSGIIEYEREQFERVYNERDSQCVIIQNKI